MPYVALHCLLLLKGEREGACHFEYIRYMYEFQPVEILEKMISRGYSYFLIATVAECSVFTAMCMTLKRGAE